MLATGNKSELAVGYSTLYGDSVGGVRADQGRAQDDGLPAGPRGATAAAERGETPPIPENSIEQAADRRAAPGPGRHATRCRDVRRCSTRSSTTTSSATRAPSELVAAGLRRASWSTRSLRMVDTRGVQAPAVPARHRRSRRRAFGRDRRLPITNALARGRRARRRRVTSARSRAARGARGCATIGGVRGPFGLEMWSTRMTVTAAFADHPEERRGAHEQLPF